MLTTKQSATDRAVFTVRQISEFDRLVPCAPDVHQLFWLRSGEGMLTIDAEQRFVSCGTIFCIGPGQVATFEESTPVEAIQLSVGESYLREANPRTLRVLGELGRSGQPIIGLPDHAQQVELKEVFQVMLDESSGSQALMYDILNGLLLVLIACFIECLRVGQTPPISREAAIVSSFLTNLENNFWSRKRVSEYASELFVSPGYLSEVVRRMSGYPASHHIRQRLLLEARRKAISCDTSAREIAGNLGFEDPSTFSKFFKNLSGSNFSNFRARRAVGP